MKKKDFGPHYIGNVIRIIDNRTLIVTTNAGLSVGNTIQVYELGPEITDLDGNRLCDYEFIKDELEVIETNEFYSVCQKNKTKTITTPSPFSQLALSPLLASTTTTEYIPLQVEKDDVQPLEIKDSYIRVGDPIKLIAD